MVHTLMVLQVVNLHITMQFRLYYHPRNAELTLSGWTSPTFSELVVEPYIYVQWNPYEYLYFPEQQSLMDFAMFL